MQLLKQTLKSFSRNEKLIALVFLILIGLSSYQIFFKRSGLEIDFSRAYTEGIVGEIKRLNPVYTEFSDADADISSLIFSGLVRYNASTGEFEEDIATHTLDEAQTTYTFTLKNEATWHDGTPVTAEDIIFTYAEVIQSPEFNNPVLKSNFDGVQIEMLNSRAVSFTLNSPNSFFFTALTVGLLPHHILGDVLASELDTHEFNKSPIGTGPYMVDGAYSVEPDGSSNVKLTRYEDYYGALPNIEHMNVVAYPDLNTLIENRSTWHGAARIRDQLLNEIELNKLIPHQYVLPQYSALFFNTDANPLTQNLVRLGLSKAIQKDEILEAIGYSVAIDTPLLQLNQEEWVLIPSQEEAQGALFDAGWALDEDLGYRVDEDGTILSLRLLRRDFTDENSIQEETAALTAEVIRNQLQAVGVEVTIEPYPAEELNKRIQERDYDMLLYGQSLGYNLDIFSYWHSSQASENGLNLSNYQNAKADFYMEEIRNSFDPEEKQNLLEGLAGVIAEDVPAVFLYTPSYYYLMDERVEGLSYKEILLPKDRFSNIEAWTFN